MFLHRLVLENVRAIRSLDLSFATGDGKTREWTFLLGENGTGKSTILRSIALLVAGSDALIELLGKPDSWIRHGEPACRLYAELVTAKGEKRELEIRIERGDSVRRVFERNQATLDDLDDALEHSTRNYFTVGYGSARRFSPDGAGSQARVELYNQLRARSVATMFAPDATLAPLDQWALNLDRGDPKDGLVHVREALDDLLEDVSFARIDRKNQVLLFKTPDGEVPLAQLGDGYQNLAAWCGDLLYHVLEAFRNYKTPLNARGLLLIDAFDMHLHPVWKRRLVSYLSSKLPRFQKVVTTYSALTVQQAGAGELYVLRRDADGVPQLHAFEGEPRKMMLHQLLLSPLVGLDTVDSVAVEEKRQQYKRLRDKAQLSGAEKRNLTKLSRELQELPDWTTPISGQEKQTALLEEIQQALKARN